MQVTTYMNILQHLDKFIYHINKEGSKGEEVAFLNIK